MNREKTDKFLIFGVVAFILISALAGIIIKDKTFSNGEKRNLTVLGNVTENSILDGSMQKEFEAYTNDQFAFRDSYVKMLSAFQEFMGSKKIQDVYIAEESLIQDYSGRTDNEIKEKADLINEFSRVHPTTDVTAMIVPTAVNIYEDMLPSYAVPSLQKDNMEYFFNCLKECDFVDVSDKFRKVIDKTDKLLYYRSDHHWTTYGARVAFLEYAEKKGIDTSSEQFNSYTVKNDFYGTLAGKTGIYNFPDQVDVWINKNNNVQCKIKYSGENSWRYSLYDTDMLESESAYNIFTGGNHPRIDISTTSMTGRKLLIIKDSYANAFIPFLIPYYTDITVIDPRYYFESIGDIVSEKAIDEVLFLYNATTFFEDTSLNDALRVEVKK